MAGAADGRVASGVSDAKHGWLFTVFGVDSRAVREAAPGGMPGGMPGGAPPMPAAPVPLIMAGEAPAAVVAPVRTPAEERKDLERRLAKSGAVYDQYGQAIGDDANAVADRLSPAEQKIGKRISEDGREMVVEGADGKKTVTPIGVGGGTSTTTFDERGVTVASKSSVTTAGIGGDGKVDEFTRERTSSTNVGLGNVTQATGDKVTTAAEGKTTVLSEQTTRSADLVKGEVSWGKSESAEVKDAAGSVKTGERSSTTVGLSGVSSMSESSLQKDKQFDSIATTTGVTRTAGQLGVGQTTTAKSGVMTGPAEAQVMEKGTETTLRQGVGLVSDDKGTGVGYSAAGSEKKLLGDGKSLTNTMGGGGKCQALVKEVAGSDPPRFTITTTISFEATVGKSGTKETAQAKPLARDAGPDTKVGGEGAEKASGTVGGSLSVAATASFKRELGYEEAKEYLDYVKANGRGGKLPEHQILATGMSQDWGAARKMWDAMNGAPDRVKALKPGEELESSFTAGAGVKAGAGAGETRTGGLAGTVEASASLSHKIGIKKTGMPDGMIQVTVTIDDLASGSVGAGASYGMASASHGENKSRGAGEVFVFSLDPKSEDFAASLKLIDKVQNTSDLEELGRDERFHMKSMTLKASATDGSTDGVGVGPVSLSMARTGSLQAEATVDADGNVTGSKAVGSSTVGVSLGLGLDVKIADTTIEAFSGEVADGQAKGEISQTHKASDLAKTLKNIAADPLGAVLNTGKVVAETVDTKGTALDDPELMKICELALNEGKWRGQVGGRAQDDWLATGEKIRKALTVVGGKIVDINKSAVTLALAEWTKSEDSGRTEVLDRLYRPFNADVIVGKGFAFPDGAAEYKADWDRLVVGDPLKGAKAKLAGDPKGALAEMAAAEKQLKTLRRNIANNEALWVGFEVQHAEMLGHINTRITEVVKAEGAAKKAAAAGPAAGDEHGDEVKAELEIYRGNVEQMEEFAKMVFGKLWQAEEKLKEWSLLGGNKVEEAMPLIYQTGDQIKLWDKLYGETFKIFQKLGAEAKLDKAALEKLHVHGAQMRWDEVNKAAHKY